MSRALIREGFYEDAVNRLYYAMFFTAEALLDYYGLRFSKHSAVIAKYGEYFSKPKSFDRRFQRSLQDAFGLRHAADYETDERLTFSRATVELLLDAQAFLAAGAALAEPTSGSIAATKLQRRLNICEFRGSIHGTESAFSGLPGSISPKR